MQQSLKYRDNIDSQIEKNFSELYELSESNKKNELKTRELIITLETNICKKIDAGLLDKRIDQICAYVCEEMSKRNFPVTFTDRTVQKYSPQEYKRCYTKKHDTTENGTDINIAKIIFKEQNSNLSELINMDLDSLTKDQKQKLYEKINQIREKIEDNADTQKIALFNRSNSKSREEDRKIIMPDKIPNWLSHEVGLWIDDLTNFKSVMETLRLSFNEEREYVKGIRAMRLFLTSFNNEKYIRSMDEWCDTLKASEDTTISGAAKLSKVDAVKYDPDSDSYVSIEKTHSVGHDQLRKYINKPDYRKFQDIMNGLPFYSKLMKLHRIHITPIRAGKEIIRTNT